MRKSTKFFLSIGFIPIVLSFASLVVALFAEAFGCRGFFCGNIREIGSNAPLIFLFGLFTAPGSAMAALLYNFISDKMGGTPDEEKENFSWFAFPTAIIRNILSIIILLSISLSAIFVVYVWLQGGGN